jgi:hypothetical protein
MGAALLVLEEEDIRIPRPVLGGISAGNFLCSIPRSVEESVLNVAAEL